MNFEIHGGEAGEAIEKEKSSTDGINQNEVKERDANVREQEDFDKPLVQDGSEGGKIELSEDPSLLNDRPIDGTILHVNETEPRLDIAEPSENGGGSYKEVCKYVKENEHENKEVHHMPADSASNLDRMDGPCIEMDKDDHRLTASCGNSRDAQEYRAAQKELIDNGNFEEAMQMDIDDIHEKFGDKYDTQINEMLKYVEKLKEVGEI